MVVVSTTSRRNRRSQHINRKPAANLYHAVKIAALIGYPLNQFVTITFGRANSEEEGISQKFEALRHSGFDPWIRRPCRALASLACPPTHVWVIEAAGGVLAAHWLVHIPPARLADFKRRLPSWLKAVTETEVEDDAIDIRPIDNPAGASLYLRKGMDPRFAPAYGVNHVPQGRIYGKRSGYTRNIGPTAKKSLKAAGRYRVRQASPSASKAARWGVAHPSTVTPG